MTSKKFHFIWCLIAILSIHYNAKAQSNIQPKDSIHYESGFLHYKYFVNGEQKSANQVLKLLPDSTFIYDNFSSANEARIFGYIFSSTGLLCMLIPSVMSAFGNNKAWGLAYAGAGIALVSVPLFIKHKNQVPKSIDAYHQLPPVKQSKHTSQLLFGIHQNGLGFCLRF